MAAPTLVIQQLASVVSAITTTITRAFTSVTVATGDRLIINGRTEDGAYHYTSVANSGTAVVSAWTRARTTGVTSTSCGNDLFTATVTTGGTLVATCTITATAGSSVRNGATLVVATGSSGTATALSTSARQLSYLTTGANSAVFTFTADWSAAASSGATFVPATNQVIDVRATDGVDQQASAGANSSVFAAHWTDTGAAATTVYGLSSPSAGTYTLTLAEFLGSASATTTPRPPQVTRTAAIRASSY